MFSNVNIMISNDLLLKIYKGTFIINDYNPLNIVI